MPEEGAGSQSVVATAELVGESEKQLESKILGEVEGHVTDLVEKLVAEERKRIDGRKQTFAQRAELLSQKLPAHELPVVVRKVVSVRSEGYELASIGPMDGKPASDPDSPAGFAAAALVRASPDAPWRGRSRGLKRGEAQAARRDRW